MKNAAIVALVLLAFSVCAPVMAEGIMAEKVQTHVKVDLLDSRGALVVTESAVFPGPARATHQAAVSFAEEVAANAGYSTREGGGELRCGTMLYNAHGEPVKCDVTEPCVDCYALVIKG